MPSAYDSTMPASSPRLINPALAPAILAIIVLLAGLALAESDAYLYIRFAVCILATIMIVFAVQGRAWLWVIPLAVVAIAWNPLFVIDFGDSLLAPFSLLASAALLATGLFMRVPDRSAESRP